MTMIRWNPWSVRSPLSRHVDRLFQDVPAAPSRWRNAGNLRIDVEDNEKDYTLTASLPGFEAEEVDISITGRTVTVSAESKSESDTPKDSYVLRERYNGSLIRRLVLPGAIDAANAASQFKNGVLTIHIPKAIGSETHKVEISTAA